VPAAAEAQGRARAKGNPQEETTVNALILVDLQNDFFPGGPMGVPEGDQVIPVVNRLQPHFDLVAATRDWHPPDHVSFVTQHEGRQPGEVIQHHGLDQILWPVHCVQGTPGAELHPDLDRNRIDNVIEKGVDRDLDSYSGFFDNGHRKATGLGDWLKEQGVTDVYVCGLATDYCVKFTALDAADLGFATYLIRDGSRGVNLHEDDVEKAIDQMRAEGVTVVDSTDIVQQKEK
jgi:nicotinamidase/pyrazinamidase